jgi:hypothetical protein
MAILTNIGRAALAEAIQARSLHLAWGEGDPAWDTALVQPLLSDTALVAELGRAQVTQVGYAIPAEAGAIEAPTGRYDLVTGPTHDLYLRFDFGFADAANNSIREVGLFMGATMVAGLPPGQTYFEPAEVDDPGIMVSVERFASPLVRSPLTRQQFEFVLTI